MPSLGLLTLGIGILAATSGVEAQRRQYTVGGGGVAWSEVALQTSAMDDTTAPGALQPRELMPDENIMHGPGERASVYGLQWYNRKRDAELFGLELGFNPRTWSRDNSVTVPELYDGDATTANTLWQLVPRAEYAQYSSATSSGSESGIAIVDQEVYTFDMGFPVPVERIRFYPPQVGLDRRGVPKRNDFPQAFEVSVGTSPEEYLILGSEVYPWHSLERVVERTLVNSRSIVDIEFPLQPVRFIRLDLTLMPQTYMLAEIEAYGRGVPPLATFTSGAIDFGERVTFGQIEFSFHGFRRSQEGELAADPAAPVRLFLETRTGTDDSPVAWYVVDELGGDREVSEQVYGRAEPAPLGRQDVRIPGRKSRIGEDQTNWGPWSSPYLASGEQSRSDDARRYLQFRATFATDEVLAFGRLDSIRFEYSSGLAREVLGRVSRTDGEGEQDEATEIQAGTEEVLAYDIQALFDAPEQRGFDAVRLDVPAGSRLVTLEVGDPLVEIAPDSISEGLDQIAVFFPSHRITAASNLPLRLTVATVLLNSSIFLTGEVMDSQSDILPQAIGESSTGSLQVFATQAALPLLSAVVAEPRVLTPNGDGSNDSATIRYHISEIDRGRIEIAIHDLAGRRVRHLLSEYRGRGAYSRDEWDGRDDGGLLVPPGSYLCHVALHTQSGTTDHLTALVVAY
ncbi:hypothetical protein ACFL6X_00255 [Candidatus Latescibacterota bacterium]